MQQLPCGCRRAGRRNCIEPNCPFESEVSRNDLYFCPIARERNLHRTGEPELCPVELPAASYTQIVCTGRCAKHRKEMEDNLQREKRREQKEREKRRELEKERERQERRSGTRDSRDREMGLGLIREGVVEDGNGDGNGNGNEDGMMDGMDENERMHVRAVLDARERARTEGLKMDRALEEVRESGLGWVDEGLKNLTLDEEREMREVVEKGMGKAEEKGKEKEEERIKEKEKEEEEEEHRVRWMYMTKEERMENARKRYTGIDALGKVKAATAMLEEMVAKDWEEDARLGNEGMTEARRVAEARRVSETLRRLENETNRSVSGSSMPRPAGGAGRGEARRVSGALQRHGNETDPNMSSVVANPSRSVSGGSVIRPRRPAGGAYQDVDDEFNRRVDEAGDEWYDLD